MMITPLARRADFRVRRDVAYYLAREWRLEMAAGKN
jgi:hypothetical protein